jgi:hypothetical protein
MFLIKNRWRQGDALSPLLFNLVLDFAIRSDRENQDGFNINDTYHILVYADDVNLLVTRCINNFNIQQLYVLATLYLCVV